ncbi:hypothetical protein CERSUDRAFT_115915 [Gelatoporia subvermispora B]|uniref:Carbohydrate kinase PfkB domain-containing protein n=1 Tax=Ceriporiopsis subvermispora (strain B) TaxID=914234 RepID=M2RC64_CERS8|nr:hypothetical protein CERSUDRAFT_115915 [Gelatoporia subvermispora B]
MTRLRRDTQETLVPAVNRPLRIIASGTLFLTQTLSLPSYPPAGSVSRAHSVIRTRGGSATTCLSILAQFPNVDAMLVAPLGGNEEGRRVLEELERERVSTRYCKIWEESGVPSAWVLHADDTDSRTVINNNPLPDVTHEDFVSLLGPLLAPENYAHVTSPGAAPNNQLPNTSSPNSPVTALNHLNAYPPRVTSQSQGAGIYTAHRPAVNSPAPFDWIHFEGRSVKTTLSNIVGLDGLARDRKWRSHCVFSVDVGRRARQGLEALIPHADVLFFNAHYARAHSPQYASSPRAFLLSLVSIAPPHALLVAHWGTYGAAVLSVPTREYFQSSGWADQSAAGASAGDAANMQLGSMLRMPEDTTDADADGVGDMRSVRTGSDFWAGAERHTDTSSLFTAGAASSRSPGPSAPGSPEARRRGGGRRRGKDGESSDSDGTQIASRSGWEAGRVIQRQASRDLLAGAGTLDEVGAQDAFVAGMIFALSRRMLPGEPYTPAAVAREGSTVRGGETDSERGRWKLEGCLRFATELAGRKARKKGWEGIAEEMTRTGWFDN